MCVSLYGLRTDTPTQFSVNREQHNFRGAIIITTYCVLYLWSLSSCRCRRCRSRHHNDDHDVMSSPRGMSATASRHCSLIFLIV